jgi:outer membrane translocation and assembly module TamA
MKIKPIIYPMIVVVMILVVSSCSTTRRLPEDEILYTGIKPLDISTFDDEKMPTDVSDQMTEAVGVIPNNSLFNSPYVRHPFPLGLWVYNNWKNPPSGFRHWIFEKLVEEPVLVSDVRPEVRTKMLNEILENNGYFRASTDYELISGRNKRKAKIRYNINAGPVYLLDSITLLPDTCHLNHVIDSVAARLPYLSSGSRYCTDSLSQARVDIANVLRNRGYYFFRPEYIEYLADSTINKYKVVLKLTTAENVPKFADQRYYTGKVTVYLYRNRGGGEPDTIKTSVGDLIQMMPSRFRTALIPENVRFKTGKVLSVRDMDRTQSNLSRLGIFSAINIEVTPDTVSSKKILDVAISCTFDSPLEASVEVNASSKSNSYIGPGMTFGVTNRNIFGGGEQFNVNLTGTYEWQTGKGSGRSIFNSYEVGLTTSLSFPRLLAPKFIPRRNRQLNWTKISLNADLLNRPHYFKMAQFNAAFSYDWQATRHVYNSLSLFKLTYTNLINTTAAFDSIMAENQAVALSFQSQFIPQIAYSYTYDRDFGNNTLNWQFTLQEAGNIFWSIWELAGQHGEKKLFDTPFSQFVKGTTQLVWGHRLGGEHWLVTRAAVGAAHAYGNSSQVPYAEQFYVGGANSVRAFTVRSIGPGSYRAPGITANDYFDQTGTFKFEFNSEYRFPILGPLHGALFLDAGNVWLLKSDAQRPGGELKASTFLKDLALGTGCGLRFDIGMLVLRGDLGIGIHAPYETGKRGYYNMTSFKDSLAFHLAIGYPF